MAAAVDTGLTVAVEVTVALVVICPTGPPTWVLVVWAVVVAACLECLVTEEEVAAAAQEEEEEEEAVAGAETVEVITGVSGSQMVATVDLAAVVEEDSVEEVVVTI